MQTLDIVQRCMSLDENVFITLDKPEDIEAELIQALTEIGFFAPILDKATIFDVDTLLHAFYQNCEFPSYFGFNWDALDECLRHFEDKPAKGYVLIYRNPRPLRVLHPDAWEILVDLFETANRSWLKYNTPFKVVLPAYIFSINTENNVPIKA
jgi:RNAse (barnase) inhibitor barstar